MADAITPSAWQRLEPDARRRIIWWLWLATWLLLLPGFFDQRWFVAVVAFLAAHALLMLILHRFDWLAFPVQVRIGYLLWVAAGTWLPGGIVLMAITAVGLATNLFFGYCPLARMTTLLPWNRSEPMSVDLLRRVFLSPPSAGRFQPPAA